jgi:hypothetical protein
MMLSHMFGGDRGALKYGYIKDPWTDITKSLIDSFDSKRMQPQSYYASPISIQRWD